MKLVDAQFPPYSQVIPQTQRRAIRAPRAAVRRRPSRRVARRERAHRRREARRHQRARCASPARAPRAATASTRFRSTTAAPNMIIGFNAQVLPRRARRARRRRGRRSASAASSIPRSSVPPARATPRATKPSSCRCASESRAGLDVEPSWRAPHRVARACGNLRNVERADLEPGPRFNVLSGDNGQGKTSLLEAIYLSARRKSFRTSKLGELVAHGRGSRAACERSVADGRRAREQSDRPRRRERATCRSTASARRASRATPCARRSSCFIRARWSLSSGPASKRRTLARSRRALRRSESMRSRQLHATPRVRGSGRSRRADPTRRELDAFEPTRGASRGRADARASAGRRALGRELRRARSARITAGAARSRPRTSRRAPRRREALAEALQRLDASAIVTAAAPARVRTATISSIQLGGHRARVDASQGRAPRRHAGAQDGGARLHRARRAASIRCSCSTTFRASSIVARTALLFEFLRESPGRSS